MIYITGATGFIGSRIATRLLQRGERIRCLVRSRTKAAPLAAAGAELIEGDLADPAVHARGVGGARGAIHLAAIYDIGVVDRDSLWHTNVDGTAALLNATPEVHTVFVSSVVALGPSSGGEPREAYDGPYHSVYHHTKAESHRLARAAQRSGAPLVVVCPSFVYGPNDEGPAGRLVDDLIRRRLPALLSRPSKFSFAYVDDVADGIIAAFDRGRAGEVYVLSGEPGTVTEYALAVCRVAGVKPPALRLPAWLALWLGNVLDPISRLTRVRFPITWEAVRTTTVDNWWFTHERASKDLKYAPRSIEAGVATTVAAAKPA